MREIYHWTEWFLELANKIAEGGEEFLIERAKRIAWKADGTEPPLLRYGDENIDPFSFFYSLAHLSRGRDNRSRIYPSIEEFFNINRQLPVGLYDSNDAFVFPMPRQQVLFHDAPQGNPQLLWSLFRGTVQGPDSVDPQNFDDALEIRYVAKVKLTQALFLINPSQFLPYDKTTNIFVHLPNNEFNWKHYREWLQKVRGMFPGCASYEISLLAYLCDEGYISINDEYFQVSTNAEGPYEGDYWEDFETNNVVYTGGGPDRYPRLRDPQRGDVILVRTGVSRGRGIGVVYKNENRDRDSPVNDGRVHVLWVNKDEAVIQQSGQLPGFSKAGTTTETFRSTPAYKRTFELLDRLSGSEEFMAKHPLNQILYGPPGTGKTYHTVDRALAIIDGERVREREEGDIQRFRELQDSGQIAMVTFHQNFAYEDFIEGIRPVLENGADGQIRYELRDGIFKQIAEAAKEEKSERFVLIIDEINRGNIAKIFGELITLIEDSRRLDEDDETKVTLPYSKDSFGVPNNLYLIGTMNTADRSIQLLDTALRRRFDFVEMMPKPELISENVEGVNCKRMLEEMNKRITALLDREHQIGHTYLLRVHDMAGLSYAFQNKIFPLLQEYFFDDWAKIRAVLGQNRFVKDGDVPNLFLDLEQADEDRTIYERLPGDDDRWTDPEEYKKIYNAGNADDTSNS